MSIVSSKGTFVKRNFISKLDKTELINYHNFVDYLTFRQN